MPELAEVAWFARQWEPGVGSRVTKVFCRARARIFRSADPGKIRRGLEGRKLTGIKTRGKQMMFVFEDTSLGVHLGMTGELLVAGRNHELGRHDHLVIRQAKRSLVFRDPRMFGAVRFEAAAEPEWWKSLAPDILSDGFTGDAVARYGSRRSGAPLKAFLLQQEMFPGIGNWMADEILWRCGFHPGRRTGTLQSHEIAVIRNAVRSVSRDAMRIIGANWSEPPQSWLFHHRWREGGRCPRDGTLLRRDEIGGRTTAWCVKCQRPGCRPSQSRGSRALRR